MVEVLTVSVKFLPEDHARDAMNYLLLPAVVLPLLGFWFICRAFVRWYVGFNNRMQTRGLWGKN
jgi:hypothetical protein